STNFAHQDDVDAGLYRVGTPLAVNPKYLQRIFSQNIGGIVLNLLKGGVCPSGGCNSGHGQPPPVGPIQVRGGCCAFAPDYYKQINDTKVNKITFDFA